MAKLKNYLLMGLSLVLVAVIAIGGTVAYLTDTDSDVNVMTMGNVSIEQIEQEWNEDQTELVDFTQAKPLLPYVGSLGWENQHKAGGAYRRFTMNNVIDKYVSVENDGKTDAFVRTVFAFEMGDYTTVESFRNKVIGLSRNVIDGDEFDFPGAWAWGTPFVAQIDGANYMIWEAVHETAVAPGKTTIPSLLQVYMNKAMDNADIASFGDTYDILVVSQAVQADGFDSAEAALNEAFGAISSTNHPWTKATQSNVADDAALKDALQNKDASTIIVNLTEDVTYDVAAWQTNAMGGEKTDLIVINGNGHKITFNNTDSDWNNIVTDGAKLVINNAHVTNSGYNNGPWNRHDLNFACEVEMNNVTSDKAFAFNAGATLNNVTIDDANASDTYAIWIQPNGQTVTLNDCTIDMIDCTDGRGIKIDEQYVDAPEKVTLKVSDTVIKTEEKSAILVKSVAGADIILDNVDITGVAADKINHVWVDSDAVAYADLVNVIGGNKIVEGQGGITYDLVITTADELFDFAKAVNNGNNYSGKTVVLAADIDLNNVLWTPIGQTGATEFKGVFDGLNHTIKNLNVISSDQTGAHYSSGLFGWIESHGQGITVKNVKVEGANIIGHHNCGVIVGYVTGDATIENCHVSNASVTCTMANNDANGDKAGVIAGNSTAENTTKVTNCSATDCTVSAGRDAGQIVGAGNAAYVTGCTAYNVTVTANGTSTGANIRSEIVGRNLG